MSFLNGLLSSLAISAEDFAWYTRIVDAINLVLWPLLIVVGAAGSIYAVVLGVQMAQADSTEKREEHKKRVINVLVAMAITIGLILLFTLFVNVILPAFFGEDGSGIGETVIRPLLNFRI